MSDDFDFGYIAQTKVTAETVEEFTFAMLPGEPSLICAPALLINEAWTRASSVAALKEIRAQKAQKVPTRKKVEEMVAERTYDDGEAARDKERVLIARHCIKGWGTPPPDGRTGKPVPFSEAAALGFLRALPDVTYEQFSKWLINEWNFVGEAAIPPGAAEAMGEASPAA